MVTRKAILILIIFIISILCFPYRINAQDKNYLTIAIGKFDFNKQVNTSTFVMAEFRPDKKILFLNPFTGVMINTDGGFFIFAGILTEINLGKYMIFTPSFAPGYYNKGNGKELFYALEFRSKLQLDFKLKNDIRLGVSFSHISNASLGPPNPGVENYALNLTFTF